MRALHTRDFVEANRRKHAALAEIHDELARIEAESVMPPESANALLETARALAEAVTTGSATQPEADLAMEIHLREQTAKLETQAYGIGASPAQIVERTLILARRTLNGGRVYRISRTTLDYLKEKAPHVTRQTLEQKGKAAG